MVTTAALLRGTYGECLHTVIGWKRFYTVTLEAEDGLWFARVFGRPTAGALKGKQVLEVTYTDPEAGIVVQRATDWILARMIEEEQEAR